MYEKQIRTDGDRFQNKKLEEIGGKNLFGKEVEENLLNKQSEIAVHSLKDRESEETEDLIIGAYIKRNDVRDAYISNKNQKLDQIKQNIIVCSSSRRRELQLKFINKKISV